MTAHDVLKLAARLDVNLSVRDGKLRVDAPAGVVDLLWLRDELATHKAALLTLLAGRSRPDPSDPVPGVVINTYPTPRFAFDPVGEFDREERAAIFEYDGGLPREEAERRAGITGRTA